MTFYTLSPDTDRELREFDELVRSYKAGLISEQEFRSRRVPFGVYEQRTPGTYMARIRCPGGAITPSQFKRVAELAEEFGSGLVHITTRQELQIHDLRLGVLPQVLNELCAVGLSTRGGGGNTVRNIIVSHDSGICPEEAFDVLPHALALTNRFLSEPDSWTLPRKLKIAFGNREPDNANARFNDLGFVARLQDGRRGFAVFVAGGMGRRPEVGHLLHPFVPEEEVYVVARAIKSVFWKYGNRRNRHTARLRFLWRQLGESEFREKYVQEVDSLRHRAEMELQISMVKPPRPGVPRHEAGEGVAFPGVEQWKRRYVQSQKQDNLFSITVPVFLGLLQASQVVELCDFLASYGEDVIRFTMQQNIQLRNVPAPDLAVIYDRVTRSFELARRGPLLGNCVACAGADTCRLGVCMPRGALRALQDALRTADTDWDPPAQVVVNLSGCPNGCGQHLLADIGFSGKVKRRDGRPYPAYTVVAGAIRGGSQARFAECVGEVASHDLPKYLLEALRLYAEARTGYRSYSEYFDDIGREHLTKLCDSYRHVPAFEEDKNYYFDWGAGEIFSLKGITSGECSAGLFDLIEHDLHRAEELGEQTEQARSAQQRRTCLYEMVVATSRALLITKGIDARSDHEVLSHFLSEFIGRGLVSARYRTFLQWAMAKDIGSLWKNRQLARSLLDNVKKLYAGMDDSLTFQQERPLPVRARRPSPQLRVTPDAHRDLRGVPCPMNFVKVKLQLAEMASGQILEVLLDDGEPIENVPRSAQAEGHQVIREEKVGEYWVVWIKKSRDEGST